MPTSNEEPFVTRFEMAVMQYVILDKAKQGEVTRENLKQTFRGNLQMTKDHFDHCLDLLVEDGHLEKVGENRYKASDDGREDVEKLQTLVLELPNVLHQGGTRSGTQRSPETYPRAGTGTGGGSTGTTVGTQPDVGTSRPQGQGAGSQQGNTQPGKISGQSGVAGQRRTPDVEKGGATRE